MAGGCIFTGHIPQVKVQITALQINKQAQKSFLSPNHYPEFVLDRCETVWPSYESIKQ